MRREISWRSRLIVAGVAIAGALLIFGPLARAADMPLKALPAVPALAYPAASGIFFGANATVDAGTATTVQGVASTALYGGDVGLSVGYTAPIAALNSFYFVEAMFDASAIQSGSNSAAAILNVKRSADFEQRFAIGVPVTTMNRLLALLGVSDGLPSLPAAPTQINPYVFLSTHEQDVSLQMGNSIGKNWAFSWGAGGGLLNRMPNGWVIDTWLEYRNSTDAFLIGPTPAVFGKVGNSVKVGVSVKFGAVKL
jgi:hypothetical protein